MSLRDFLLVFFFIELGATLELGLLGGQVGAAIVVSLFVLIGNPLIVMAIMSYMGYRKRTGFLAGLTVAQISEFSLILAALGLSLGHLEPGTVGLIRRNAAGGQAAGRVQPVADPSSSRPRRRCHSARDSSG